jgi:hypothetical protein
MASARLGGVHVNPKEHPMAGVSKTLIFASALAVIATAALSEAGGPGKMATMGMADAEQNHDAMIRHAAKVPENTLFFMDNGSLYSVSGRLDPTGNFHMK